ncbi:MAG: luciferase family protein [Actinomycetota bacterium]
MSHQSLSIHDRQGERPRTNPTMPHQQESDNAPTELQEALFDRVLKLPGVETGRSHVSVPGARAFFLEESRANGPGDAFIAGREFAHLHPPQDGSLHLALPESLAREVVDAGWGEFHPGVDLGFMPPNSLMVYGPRTTEELETVWQIVEASYRYASGEPSSA